MPKATIIYIGLGNVQEWKEEFETEERITCKVPSDMEGLVVIEAEDKAVIIPKDRLIKVVLEGD